MNQNNQQLIESNYTQQAVLN